MRRSLIITAAVIIVLVAVVLLIAETPLGLRVGLHLAERLIEERTGLDVEVGRSEGRLASPFLLENVTLSVPGGPPILAIERARVSYDTGALLLRRGLSAEVVVDGAAVLLETVDGGLLGWKEMAGLSQKGDEADTLRNGAAFAFDVALSARDAAVTFKDTASGVLAGGLIDGDCSFGPGSFAVSLEGSLSVSAPQLSSSFDGRFAGEVRDSGAAVDVTSFSLSSDALTLTATGRVEAAGPERPPTLRFDVTSRLDLALAASLSAAGAGGSAPSGSLDVTATIEGGADSLSYSAVLSSPALSAGGVDVRSFDARLRGGRTSVLIESARGDLLGGSVLASGGAAFEDGGFNGEFRAEASRLDMAALPGLAPVREGAARPTVEGRASLSASISGSGVDLTRPSPETLSGSVHGSVHALSVDGRSYGDVALDGALRRGVATLDARCCSTSLTASGDVTDAGVDAVSFSVLCGDLAAPAAVFGVDGLEGTLSAEGRLSLSSQAPKGTLTLEAAEGAYRGTTFAPARAEVAWSGGTMTAEFSALSRVLSGAASVAPDGSYSASFVVDGLDLASVLPDSIVREWSLSGSASGRGSVAGDTSGVRSFDGEVTELLASARGHNVALDAPFTFRAAEDTVSVSYVSMTGDFGWISASGSLAKGEEGRIAARFRALDIAALSDLASIKGLPPLSGRFDGGASVEGDLSRPSVIADMAIDKFSVAGIKFDSVTLYAESDTTDLVFDVDANSATSGQIHASASIPLLSPRGGLPSFDSTREFGLSLVCDKLELEAGSYLMPMVRGASVMSATGSVLLTGRADSLRSIHGRGSFEELAITFDLLRFAVADTLDFDVDGGAVVLPPTTVAMTRRRVLENESGGRIVMSGSVARDGSLSASASARGAQIPRLVRTFSPRANVPLEGDIDLDVVASGTVKEPVIEMTWEVKRPVLSGLAFAGLGGKARIESDSLVIERAALSAGNRSIEATGSIGMGLADGSAVPALDLQVLTSGFDLGTIRLTDPQISRLGGVLDADLKVSGPADLPMLEGRVSLRKGAFRGFGLEKPVEDIVVNLTADGHTAALNGASATIGGGSMSATGFAAVGGGNETTFWLKSKLNSPRVVIKQAFDARVKGNLMWTGDTRQSEVSGALSVEDATVSYDVGLGDLIQRRPVRVTVRRPGDLMANVHLDVEVNVKDKLAIDNNLVDLALTGGVHMGGTAYAPQISGGFYAEEGRFRFLENEFELESLSVAFTDPRRSDPYVDLTGSADVSDRAGETYSVTVRVQGFALEAVPAFTSDPSLSEPDIISLLTFGDTAGTLVGGGEQAGSSGDVFGSIARNAFLSRAFGVAENALERLLRLDTVVLDDEAIMNGNAAGADVTLGKRFGNLLRVNYTTAVGRLDEQQIEVALELTKYLALESRADPEGDHAIDIRLRIPFR